MKTKRTFYAHMIIFLESVGLGFLGKLFRNKTALVIGDKHEVTATGHVKGTEEKKLVIAFPDQNRQTRRKNAKLFRRKAKVKRV